MIQEQLAQTTNDLYMSRDSIAPSTPAADIAMSQRTCVDIYIAEHCFVCEYSLEVAEFIREQFPHVEVRLIDIADPTADIPEAVFATPTFLFNGKLWSLGNPSNEDIVNKLAEPYDLTTDAQ